MVTVPRLVIAAPASGHGKTTVTTGLLAALAARGLTASGHKVGPDYIDPGYHALVTGRPGRNLDPWLVGEDRIAPLFLHGAYAADVAVIEGVTGLFDGAIGTGGFASTAHVAALLDAPVVLVVDARGQGRSVAALVHGFATYDPAVRIGGVVLNRVGSDRHEEALRESLDGVGIPVLGVLRRDDALAVPSRHLGLIPAAERVSVATKTVRTLGEAVSAQFDLDAVLALARSAPQLAAAPWDPATEATPTDSGRPRVAIAGGAAFTFGYPETAELLTAAGAEVVPLDPLRDETLPEGTAGLILGGGFPEEYAGDLSANEPLRDAIAALGQSGAPIVAECAGLTYLARSLDGKPMCGLLDTEARMTGRLTLGYREAVAASDSVLGPAGTRVRGHEFHRTTCTPAAGPRPAWRWKTAQHDEHGFAADAIHASYLHLHLAGHPALARHFLVECEGGRGGVALSTPLQTATRRNSTKGVAR